MRQALPLLALVGILSSGCQQMFTYSLAKPLAREPEVISSLDAAGAASVAAMVAASADVELAAAAVGALADLVAADPTNTAILADAAAVAVVASGLDQALTQAMTEIDVAGLMNDPSAISSSDIDTIAALVAGVAASDAMGDSTAIFASLADAAASDPAALAASGIGAETLVMAAAVLTIAEMESQGVTLAEVEADPSVFTAPALLTTQLGDLADLVASMDADNQFLAALQGFLPIP
jgi:hypothetical protein